MWDDLLYVDGSRSAPKIVTALADALEWMIRRKGVWTGSDIIRLLSDMIPSDRAREDKDLYELKVTIKYTCT